MNKVQECVGCGHCCIQALCPAALRIWPEATICPALIWSWDHGRYLCNLVMGDTPKAREYREELYIGEGCCQALNSWRQDVRPRLGEEQIFTTKALGQVMEVFVRTLSKQFISGDVVALTILGTIKELRRKGVPEEEIQNIYARIQYVFSENRPKFVEKFQG